MCGHSVQPKTLNPASNLSSIADLVLLSSQAEYMVELIVALTRFISSQLSLGCLICLYMYA